MANYYEIESPELKNEYVEIVSQLNEDLRDWVIRILSEAGFGAYDVKCGESGWSHRCRYVTFRLSGVWSGWKFGLWLYGEELLLQKDDDCPAIWFFVQHETLIDKFKPSRSPMKVDIRWREVNYTFRWAKMEIVDMVRAIRSHPVLVYEGVDAMYLPKGPLAIQALKSYATDRLDEIQRRRSYKLWLAAAKSMAGRLSGMDCVKKCTLEHYEKHRYPPISLDVYMNDDPSDDDLAEVLSIVRKRNHGRHGIHGWETLVCSVVYRRCGEWIDFI